LRRSDRPPTCPYTRAQAAWGYTKVAATQPNTQSAASRHAPSTQRNAARRVRSRSRACTLSSRRLARGASASAPAALATWRGATGRLAFGTPDRHMCGGGLQARLVCLLQVHTAAPRAGTYRTYWAGTYHKHTASTPSGTPWSPGCPPTSTRKAAPDRRTRPPRPDLRGHAGARHWCATVRTSTGPAL